MKVGHLFVRLSLFKNQARAVAACDTQIGILRLARAVDNATHHGDFRFPFIRTDKLRHLVRKRHTLPSASTASGAGNDLYVFLLQTASAQNILRRVHFLNGISRERNANGIPNPLQEQTANPDCAFHNPHFRRTCFRYANVQGIVRFFR